MKNHEKNLLILAGVILLLLLIFFVRDIDSDNDPVFEATGWTIEQFIVWANENEPVKEHKLWKIWQDGRKELMDPNEEDFHYGVRIDANDVSFAYPMYGYGWKIVLSKDLPEPVIKVLEHISFQHAGKYSGEFLPIAKPVAICALKNGKVVSSEDVEVKLISLSDNKLSFSVETEPFILSMVSEVRGKINGKMVLYVPKDCEVGICKPRKTVGKGG